MNKSQIISALGLSLFFFFFYFVCMRREKQTERQENYLDLFRKRKQTITKNI